MVTTLHGVELPVALQPARRWSDEELFGFAPTRMAIWAWSAIPKER